MRIRTKIGVCVGVIVMLLGFVLASLRTESRAVSVSFVRYETNGAAVLKFDNRSSCTVLCRAINAQIVSEQGGQPQFFVLLPPRSHSQSAIWAVASIPPSLWLQALPRAVSIQCKPLRWRIQDLLREVGINIGSTGFVVSVDLPPSGSNAPAQPVTP